MSETSLTVEDMVRLAEDLTRADFEPENLRRTLSRFDLGEEWVDEYEAKLLASYEACYAVDGILTVRAALRQMPGKAVVLILIKLGWLVDIKVGESPLIVVEGETVVVPDDSPTILPGGERC